MRVCHPLPEALLRLATGRHGVVSTAELRRAGVDRGAQERRVAASVLQPELRGAVVVPELRDRFTRVAAIQLIHPAVVAERRTAAALWRLDGFRDGRWYDLAVPPGKRIRLPGMPAMRRARLPSKAVVAYDGLRVTTPTWTLGELGAVGGVDADLVELALEAALRANLTTEAKLHAVIRHRPGSRWPGTTPLAEALGRRAPGAPPTGSYAETRFLQCIVRPLGLLDPRRQVPIRARGRRKPYLADFVFHTDVADLVIEIDGLHTHGTPEALDHDLLRDEHIQAEGYRLKRFAAWRVDGDQVRVRRSLLRELSFRGERLPPEAPGA